MQCGFPIDVAVGFPSRSRANVSISLDNGISCHSNNGLPIDASFNTISFTLNFLSTVSKIKKSEVVF